MALHSGGQKKVTIFQSGAGDETPEDLCSWWYLLGDIQGQAESGTEQVDLAVETLLIAGEMD